MMRDQVFDAPAKMEIIPMDPHHAEIIKEILAQNRLILEAICRPPLLQTIRGDVGLTDISEQS